LNAAALPNLDSIIRGLLYVYVFSLPFKRLLFIERNGFIILIVLLVLWCAANQRHFFLKTPVDLPLIAFVAWVGFTVPFAMFPAYSSKEYAKLLQQALMFYVVVYFFRSPVHRRRLVWMLIGTLAIVSLYGIWQYVSDVKDHVSYHSFDSLGELAVIESFLPGEVWLTTYLVMLIPFALAMALKKGARAGAMVSGFSAFSGAVCQVLTFSRAGFVSLLAEALATAFIVRRRWVMIAAAVFIVCMGTGAGLLYQFRSASGGPLGTIADRKFDAANLVARLNVWAYGLGRIPERPLTGFGYGKDNFYMVFGRETDTVHVPGRDEMPAGTHNVFVDLAVGTGPVGLALFVWLLGVIGYCGYNTYRHAGSPFQGALSLGLLLALAGFVIRNSFDHMMVGSLAVLFWVLVALALSANEHQP
jgi:hypothetical protein